jgi:hypothetical protein
VWVSGSAGSYMCAATVARPQVAVTEVTTSSSYLPNLSGKPTGKSRWTAFFTLIFRHSACQHPLIASGVARMATDKANAEVISAADGAMQQILSMTMSNSLHVVTQGCRTLSALAACPDIAPRMIKQKVRAKRPALACCGRRQRGRHLLATARRPRNPCALLAADRDALLGCGEQSRAAANSHLTRLLRPHAPLQVMQSLYHLLGSDDLGAREAGLMVVADLAFTCEEVSAAMCTPFLLATLMQLANMQQPGAKG